jgi:small subunit ribosomal protein S1
MSEVDWTNKNINPAKAVTLGQEVEVMVLEIDPNRRRISLGMKQCLSNPWADFAAAHKKGDKITAKIKSITDFGLFLGLEGGIDGLVHLSDISWAESGEQAINNYKKGQDVEAVILAVDADRERISLGIKQLQGDIYADYLTQNPRGTVIKGKVTEVNQRYALVDLGGDIVGKIRAADASRLTVKDVTDLLAVDDEIEAKILGVDKKSRQINLSIRELQPDIGSENAPGNTQLGDLLKEQMEEQSEDADLGE